MKKVVTALTAISIIFVSPRQMIAPFIAAIGRKFMKNGKILNVLVILSIIFLSACHNDEGSFGSSSQLDSEMSPSPFSDIQQAASETPSASQELSTSSSTANVYRYDNIPSFPISKISPKKVTYHKAMLGETTIILDAEQIGQVVKLLNEVEITDSPSKKEADAELYQLISFYQNVNDKDPAYSLCFLVDSLYIEASGESSNVYPTLNWINKGSDDESKINVRIRKLIDSWAQSSKVTGHSFSFVKADNVEGYSEKQIKELVSQLLEKATSICMLGDCQDFDQENKAAMKTDVKNGIIYAPVLHSSYSSTNEIREDMYTTFAKETADSRFAYMFNTIYRDFDGKLFCAYSATGYRKIHQWNVDTLQSVNLTNDKITVKMDCTVIDDTFLATLELIKVDDHWVLNDTYFAMAP